MTGLFCGCATAMITPFTKSSVDFDSLGEMIEYQLASAVKALVFLGTTGEPATMSESEREDTIRFAVSQVAHRAKVIVGAGSNDTALAVAAAKRAEQLGADGLLVVTPYYNMCTQAGLLAYYRTVCEAVGIPVLAYHVPRRTGVPLLPETAEALSEIENFAGIKDAGGNMTLTLDILRRVRDRCDVYSGEDLLNLPILCAGGAGVISVVSNLAPGAVVELTEAVQTGKFQRAIALADALFPLTKACFSEVNPIPVKEGMNLLGFRAGVPRPPLTQIEAAHRDQLIAEMKKFGLEVHA